MLLQMLTASHSIRSEYLEIPRTLLPVFLEGPKAEEGSIESMFHFPKAKSFPNQLNQLPRLHTKRDHGLWQLGALFTPTLWQEDGHQDAHNTSVSSSTQHCEEKQNFSQHLPATTSLLPAITRYGFLNEKLWFQLPISVAAWPKSSVSWNISRTCSCVSSACRSLQAHGWGVNGCGYQKDRKKNMKISKRKSENGSGPCGPCRVMLLKTSYPWSWCYLSYPVSANQKQLEDKTNHLKKDYVISMDLQPKKIAHCDIRHLWRAVGTNHGPQETPQQKRKYKCHSPCKVLWNCHLTSERS